jgi:hypothetical protein
MANGVNPDKFQVDHVDRNTLNNNVENLRLLTPSPQAHNRGMRSDNTSGVTGAHLHKKTGKWRAKLTNERKIFHLGLHTCLIEAILAYNNKVIELGLDKLGKPLNDLEALECGCGHCAREGSDHHQLAVLLVDRQDLSQHPSRHVSPNCLLSHGFPGSFL